MYGDIIEISRNTIFIEGLEPELILREPDIASSVLYKSKDTLYIMDTGATLFFRKQILKGVEKLKPFKNLILLNSHGHPDHTPNNSVINEIQAEKKEHYLSKVGIPFLDYFKRTRNDFNKIAEYYNIEDGPGFPISILFKPLKVLRIINPKIIDYNLTNFITKKVMSKFVPLEPSKETVIPFENQPSIELPIKSVKLKGWNFNDDIYVIESRGHTPDSVSFYLPKEKVLFLSDETVDYFNCWGDTNSKRIVQILKDSITMYRNGEVDTLIGGHQQSVYRNEMIPELLNRLIDNHFIFRKELLEIIKKHSEGITVKKIYKELQKKRYIPAINSYFKYEFPKMPGMLKTNITFALFEEGLIAEGPVGNKIFKMKE